MELLLTYLKSVWYLHITRFLSVAGKVISTFIRQATTLVSRGKANTVSFTNIAGNSVFYY